MISHLAGTAFHSSQKVMNEEVTKMIPGGQKIVETVVISFVLQTREKLTRDEDCREVESSVPRKCQFDFET
jgi:hypothetical protein